VLVVLRRRLPDTCEAVGGGSLLLRHDDT
jgi:hypothetical protein